MTDPKSPPTNPCTERVREQKRCASSIAAARLGKAETANNHQRATNSTEPCSPPPQAPRPGKAAGETGLNGQQPALTPRTARTKHSRASPNLLLPLFRSPGKNQ